MNTREKRIKVGEKRKLYGLKQKADFQDRKSKILKQGCHFDTIMDEKLTFDDNNGNGKFFLKIFFINFLFFLNLKKNNKMTHKMILIILNFQL